MFSLNRDISQILFVPELIFFLLSFLCSHISFQAVPVDDSKKHFLNFHVFVQRSRFSRDALWEISNSSSPSIDTEFHSIREFSISLEISNL